MRKSQMQDSMLGPKFYESTTARNFDQPLIGHETTGPQSTSTVQRPEIQYGNWKGH